MASLDKSLLYKIMHKVGEIEGGAPNFADTNDFLNLIGKQLDQAELEDMWYIDRHLVFLKECGFISLGSSTYEGKRGVKLTAQGNMFLQPELAEFGNQSLLPDVIKALEERIQALTYPEEEKRDCCTECERQSQDKEAISSSRSSWRLLPATHKPTDETQRKTAQHLERSDGLSACILKRILRWELRRECSAPC
jgi:hypothetical protein